MAVKKSRARAASAHVAARETTVGRGTATGRFLDGKPKLVVATKAPEKTDVQAGVERLAQVAKTSNVDVSVFNALIDELADAMTDRQSTELGLTEQEANFLIESGDFTPEEFAEAAAFVTSGGLAKLERETHVRALTNTYTASEVAALLGIDASSVRHRQSKNTLYGFRAGRIRLYPRWQFIPGEKVSTIPHQSLEAGWRRLRWRAGVRSNGGKNATGPDGSGSGKSSGGPFVLGRLGRAQTPALGRHEP